MSPYVPLVPVRAGTSLTTTPAAGPAAAAAPVNTTLPPTPATSSRLA